MDIKCFDAILLYIYKKIWKGLKAEAKGLRCGFKEFFTAAVASNGTELTFDSEVKFIIQPLDDCQTEQTGCEFGVGVGMNHRVCETYKKRPW